MVLYSGNGVVATFADCLSDDDNDNDNEDIQTGTILVLRSDDAQDDTVDDNDNDNENDIDNNQEEQVQDNEFCDKCKPFLYTLHILK